MTKYLMSFIWNKSDCENPVFIIPGSNKPPYFSLLPKFHGIQSD